MTFRTLILPKIASASLLMAGVFTANTAMAKTQQNAHVQTSEPAKVELIHFSEGQSYRKTGSPIRYSYSMPKTLAVGQTVTLDLKLSEPFEAGDLLVSCDVKGDVSLHANSGSDSFSMAGSDSHEMQVSFTANSLGRHYIQVAAISTSDGLGANSRYFSIPVQVGPKQPLPPHPGLTRTPSGQMVISMKATEDIK